MSSTAIEIGIQPTTAMPHRATKNLLPAMRAMLPSAIGHRAAAEGVEVAIVVTTAAVSSAKVALDHPRRKTADPIAGLRMALQVLAMIRNHFPRIRVNQTASVEYRKLTRKIGR
jgi:hypothetical protein